MIPAVLVAVAATIVPSVSRLEAPRADSVPGSELTVYLLTFDPGALIWERFGHNALWISDRKNGTDWGYDYGRFTFGRTFADRLRFFARFAKGDLNYSMGDAAVRQYLDGYAAAGRSIWVQELDLPPPARLALRVFLDWNRTEEHRYYRYHYYLDNCSTRIRDAIDRVLGGQIKAWADTVQTAWSWRDHTRRTTESDPLMYTLLTIGLGQPTDQPITAWEEMFLPISLRPYLDLVSVRDGGGPAHPLVKQERHLVESDRYRVADRPSGWTWRYLLVGLGFGGLLAGLGRLGRGSARWRYAFTGIGGLWSLLAGLSGLVLAGLWGLTSHHFASRNENLFQLNLVSLVVAATIPKGVLGGDPTRRSLTVFAAGLVAALGVVGLALKVLPAFGQSNLDVIAMILPIHVGLFAGLRMSQGGLLPPGSPVG